MSSEQTFQTVVTILADKLNISEEEIQPASSLQEDLGADSLDALELIMAIEDEFEIEIDTTQAAEIKLVSDLVSLIDTIKQ